MAEKPKDKEEARFNDALKRMLKTPPKPKEKGDDKSRRPPKSDQPSRKKGE